jgi:hypothetical protein
LTAHRTIVAWGFKLTGLLVGVPSAGACGLMTIESMRAHQAAAPDDAHMISVHTYGIAGLLTDAGVGFDRLFGALAGLAAWAFGVLAVAALIAALWAALIYLIGRGVGRGATWARIAGGAFTLGLALVSFLAITSLPHRLMIAPLPLLALALYTLWTLIWRFGGAQAGPPRVEAATDVGV